MRRLLGLLPPGTVAVGSGLAVLGLASYVHISIASHTLGGHSKGYGAFAVLWAIVFTIGLGLFFPIEQEVTRIVAARRVNGDGNAAAFRRGAMLSLVLFLVVCVLLAVFAPLIADKLFDGERDLVPVMAGGFAGLALAYPTRGVLAGTGRFGAYGAQLGIDGGLRIVLAAVLGVLGVRSPVMFGLILLVAPVISVVATAGPVRAALTPGSPLSWRTFGRRVAPLMASTLLAQVVVNIAVINAKLLAPHADALTGALLSALTLVRIPLFVFGSLQASLLPGLSSAAASDDRTGFRKLLLRACGIVLTLGVAGGVPAIVFGPWLLRLLFATSGVLGDGDFAVLAVGTAAYLLAQVLGQAAMALGHHRDQTLAWLGGTVALAAVTALPMDVKLRVEWAYTVGSIVVALILVGTVIHRTNRQSAADRAAHVTGRPAGAAGPDPGTGPGASLATAEPLAPGR
ncbi:lipopolysaccharide biosynthesis protein [Rugosimonospora africana]|uniref:Membrane protein n=1 Tax=Rugosimonospora africana TaxID=556532 RepID=A0A8J3VQ03_9ACTN|nr:polysaccharide biosynthesis protein [Rugosimonospora africana]GIH13961.1 membrane protein [Rugosimonospora africana]